MSTPKGATSVRGGVAPTQLTAGIGSSDLTFVVSSVVTADWPDTTIGKFLVTLDRGVIGSEEQVYISSITSTSFVVAPGDRGANNTTAVGHQPGCTVTHTNDASAMQDVIEHVYDTTRDDHPQYGGRPQPGQTGQTGIFYLASPTRTNTANGGVWTAGVVDYEVAIPFFVAATTVVKTVSIWVDSANVGGTVDMRVGIRSDSGHFQPGTLIYDSGAISCAATGLQTVTLATPITLLPGWYWTTNVLQTSGTVTTYPGFVELMASLASLATTGPTAYSSIIGAGEGEAGIYQQSGVTGALPAGFTPLSTYSASTDVVAIWLGT